MTFRGFRYRCIFDTIKCNRGGISPCDRSKRNHHQGLAFTTRAEKQLIMKQSRIADMVTALLLVMMRQTLATLPVMTALSMGSLLANTRTVGAITSTPKSWRQCALDKEKEVKDYMACVLDMSGPGRHREKGRKRVCHPRPQVESERRGLGELDHAEDGADTYANVCFLLVGVGSYDDMIKLCVSGGMEE